MTEQLPTNQVSLDDLKRALDHYEWASRHGLQITVLAVRSEAWRTAFEWRDSHSRRSVASLASKEALDQWLTERDEGMALIREKLR